MTNQTYFRCGWESSHRDKKNRRREKEFKRIINRPTVIIILFSLPNARYVCYVQALPFVESIDRDGIFLGPEDRI